MTWTAYVDESEPSSGGTYILSCALVDGANAQETRTAMLAAKQPHEKKIHWHERLPSAQPELVELVAGLATMHLLVIRDDCHDERSERRRRKCLERLFYVLDSRYRVPNVVLEARQAKQNGLDRKLLDVMRASKQISGNLRLDHIPGPKEALLWIPDVVAGAFTAGRTGHTDLYEPLVPLVEIERTQGQ